MDYNSQDYANTTGQSYILNYTGTVKYYYLDENNNKIDLTFQCQNASFSVDYVGNITWRSGNFLSGTWYNGQWYNSYTNDNGQTWNQSTELVSSFQNGVWLNGTWYNGQWYNGSFNQGIWYNGYWYDGIFGYDNIFQDNITAEWMNGKFYGGIFYGTKWDYGYFYTNSNPSYWLQKDNEIRWFGGYLNDQIRSSSPIQSLRNNSEFLNYTGIIYYVYIHNYRYEIKDFTCSNASFEIDLSGLINTTSGSFYNSQFISANLSNSNFTNFTLQQCIITNCNIYNSVITNCDINNTINHTLENSVLTSNIHRNGNIISCIWYDGQFLNGQFNESIWYDGIWADGYWYTENSVWYDGTWLNGYIDNGVSEMAPYILANNQSFQNFNGKLKYEYIIEEQTITVVISVNNANIDVDQDGIILFTNGTWNDGQFYNGIFINSEWINGTFTNGRFQNSIWNNGQFNNGTIYSSQWINGNFNDGNFQNSIWNNGQFYNGEFKSSIWKDGNFRGGNWNTLNSFWFGGYWIDGTQNGSQPLNYIPNKYVQYLQNETLQDQVVIDGVSYDNVYIINNPNNYTFNLTLYDPNNQEVEIQTNVSDYESITGIGYLVIDDKIYLFFKNPILEYYRLQYYFILNDISPKIRLMDDYVEYLSDKHHLITGEFDYIVQDEDNNKTYYSIRVKDANFSINNGYIIWNTGIFEDGIWYNGKWNAIDIFDGLLEISNIEVLNILDKCIWENGIWMNGNWNWQNSIWKNGQWISGFINDIECNFSPDFQLGNGKNYANYIGQLKYIYTDEQEVKHFGSLFLDDADLKISNEGFITFNKGTFKNGYWNNGEWYGDIWKNGIWNNGTWYCGKWVNGTWHNGEWIKSNKYNKELQPTEQYGSYRTIGTTIVYSQLDIPTIGFFIVDQQPSNFSYESDNSYVYDKLTDEQYNKLYGNYNYSSYSDYSNISDNSDSSYSDGYIIEIKKWVDSQWVQGFIGSVKSYYPPIYNIANGNDYYDFTEQLVYYYPKYKDGVFLYNQFYLLKFSNASFSVSEQGYILWKNGMIYNSEWNNGEFKNGYFIDGIWHNGIFTNGYFMSGTWQNGTWNNGYLKCVNTTWSNGTWKKGYIDQDGVDHYIYSEYSPLLLTANNHLFLNYSGQVKYKTYTEYNLIDVSNAYFYVDNNGQVIFYAGTWNNGTFNGIWKTAKFNQTYNYILNNTIIEMNHNYIHEVVATEYVYSLNKETQLNKYKLTYNAEVQQINLFNDTNQYNSRWIQGTFASGVWYNGQWVDGEWLTDDSNQPIGEWKNGIIGGIVQTEAPAYTIVDDNKDEYIFNNFTGRIKYKVNFFNDQTYKIRTYFNTFSCKNAFFKIKYSTVTKEAKTFRQIFIEWFDGTWNDGKWHRGLWHKGTWNKGTWEMGIWVDGTWKNGQWICGNWYNGTWIQGTQTQISVLNMIN